MFRHTHEWSGCGECSGHLPYVIVWWGNGSWTNNSKPIFSFNTFFFIFKDPILRNIEEYRLVVPISTDSEGRFLSNLVSGPPRGRFRRDAGDLQHEASNEQIFYNVTVFGREFHFRLRLNSRLVAPGATIEWQEDSNVTHIQPLHGNCLYVGDITDLPNASVAISNCDGLVSCFAIIPNNIIILLNFPIVYIFLKCVELCP